MKMTKRLIADLILAIALGFTMAYTLTGGLIHEILGMLLLIGFLVHLIIRRSYYKGAFRSWRRGRLQGFQPRASLILNLVLIIATVVMLISSIAISRELFFFLNSAITSYDAWRAVHIICAVVLAIGVFVHICLHAKMFATLVRRSSDNLGAMTAWNIFSRIAAFIVAVLIAFFSVKSISDATVAIAYAKEYAVTALAEDASVTGKSASASDDSDSVIISDQQSEVAVITEEPSTESEAVIIDEPVPEETEIIDEPEPAEDVPTLDDYLSAITCTGCGKHCSLLTPQCGKGRSRAAAATEQYYEEYGSF